MHDVDDGEDFGMMDEYDQTCPTDYEDDEVDATDYGCGIPGCGCGDPYQDGFELEDDEVD